MQQRKKQTKIRRHSILGLLMMLAAYGSFGQVKKDSLLFTLNTQQLQDTERVNIHEKLAYYYRFNSPDSAFYHAMKGYQLADSVKYSYGLVYCLNHLGSYYLMKGSYNTAIEYHRKAAQFNRSADPRVLRGVALAVNNIGMVQFERGRLSSAEMIFRKALKIDESLAYQRGIARELGNIGKVLSKREKFDSALVYYEKALRIEQDLNHMLGILETMVDIAKVHFAKKDFAKASAILNSASSVNVECHLAANVWIQDLKAEIALKQRDYTNALKLKQQAFQNASLLGDISLKTSIAKGLADIYKSLGRYQEASVYLDTFSYYLATLERAHQQSLEEDLIHSFANEKKQSEVTFLQESRNKMLFYNSRLISMRNGLVISLCFSFLAGFP